MSQRPVKLGRKASPAVRAPRRVLAVVVLLSAAAICLAALGAPAAVRLFAAVAPSAGAQAMPPPNSPSREYIYAGGRVVATEEAAEDAAFVSQTTPASMINGRTYSVTLVMRNTGTTTWTSAAGYALGSHNPPDNNTWGLSRVALPAPVAPGAEASFQIQLTAPATPGPYNFQWRMVRGGSGWFGAPSTNVSVSVLPGGSLTALFGAQTATVNLSAEGTQDWAHWGLSSESSFDHKAGVSSQISNYTVLGAGAISRFSDLSYTHVWNDGTPTQAATTTTGVFASGAAGNGFRITAPADTNTRTMRLYVGAWYARAQFRAELSDGSAPVSVDDFVIAQTGTANHVYEITYKAASAGQTLTISYTLKDNYNAPFGNVTLQAATLMLGAPPPRQASNSAFVWQSVPTSMTAGQPYTVAVTMRNTGVNSWTGTATTGYRLGSQNPQDNNAWGLTRVPLSSSHLPGAEATFVFTVRAPSTPGVHHFQWRMVAEGVGGSAEGWFGEYTPDVAVNVTPSSTGGTIKGSAAAMPSGGSVDLTNEGALDWGHWGLYEASSFIHKGVVSPQISNYTVLGGGAVSRFADLSYTHTWTDGWGTPSATANTGVFISGTPGNGFQLTAPADTTSRTLKLYVGAWYAKGELTAQLSDGSAPTYTNVSVDATGGTSNYAYVLTYKAGSAGQTLTVSYTLKTNYNAPYGNVTLQAATLGTGPAPPPGQEMTAPPKPTGLVATANTTTSVELSWAAPATTSVISGYVVERAQSIGAFVPVASNVTATAHTDAGLAANTAYLYRVKAIFATGDQSDYSNEDLATTVIFAETLTPNVTTISASHLTELRRAVNAVRGLAPGLGAAAWTYPDPVSTPPEQRRWIYLEDVADLRTNLDAALMQLGRFQPYPATPPLARGAAVSAEHFNQIRQRVR